MPYELVIDETAADEIEALRAFDRRRVIAAMEDQLSQQPTIPTRNRKCLAGLIPRFEHVLPVWELRFGKYRVFYDVNEPEARVYIRAVRVKDAGRSTEDIA